MLLNVHKHNIYLNFTNEIFTSIFVVITFQMRFHPHNCTFFKYLDIYFYGMPQDQPRHLLGSGALFEKHCAIGTYHSMQLTVTQYTLCI